MPKVYLYADIEDSDWTDILMAVREHIPEESIFVVGSPEELIRELEKEPGCDVLVLSLSSDETMRQFLEAVELLWSKDIFLVVRGEKSELAQAANKLRPRVVMFDYPETENLVMIVCKMAARAQQRNRLWRT